jgi:hypothetical protein
MCLTFSQQDLYVSQYFSQQDPQSVSHFCSRALHVSHIFAARPSMSLTFRSRTLHVSNIFAAGPFMSLTFRSRALHVSNIFAAGPSMCFTCRSRALHVSHIFAAGHPMCLNTFRSRTLIKSHIFAAGPSVSHQWCDLFYRLLHSYTRHIEGVVGGERDILLSAQE